MPDPEAADGTAQFVYAKPGEEVRAVGGTYTVVEELRLAFEHATLLVLVGAACFDTTCCGAGGSSFALVAGEIVTEPRDEADGLRRSRVRPLADPARRARAAEAIRALRPVHEVRFHVEA